MSVLIRFSPLSRIPEYNKKGMKNPEFPHAHIFSVCKVTHTKFTE